MKEEKEAYCLKCKSMHEIQNPQEKEKNGKFFLQGTCKIHGNIMTRLLGRKKGVKKAATVLKREDKLLEVEAGEFEGRVREAMKLIQPGTCKIKEMKSEEKPVLRGNATYQSGTTPKIESMTAFRDTLIAGGSMIVSLSLGTPLPLLALLLLFVGTRHFTALMDNVVDILSGVKQFIGRAGKFKELQDKEKEVKELTEKAVAKEKEANEKFILLDSKIKEFEERIGRAIETINVDEVIRRMNLGQERNDKYQVELIGAVKKHTEVVEVIAKNPISLKGDINEFRECIKEMREIMQGEVVEIPRKETLVKPKEKIVEPILTNPKDIELREKVHYNLRRMRLVNEAITAITGFTASTINEDVKVWEGKLKAKETIEKPVIEVPAQ